MYQIFVGSLLLTLIHTLIPNHWMPVTAISKAEKWNRRQVFRATIITGLAHTLSTVIVGVLVGIVGYKLSAKYGLIAGTIAPALLAGLGIIYLMIEFMGPDTDHGEKGNRLQVIPEKSDRSKRISIVTSLSIAMFLTPCVEIEAYYFQAGAIGWAGIIIVSAVYTITTLIVMLALVSLGTKAVNKINSRFMERHEKGITGLVLIGLGTLAFFVTF